MTRFNYKLLRLIPVLLCLSIGSSAKTNSIIAGFRIESSGNSHFSFIATATSSVTPLDFYWDLGDGGTIGWGSVDIVNHTYAVSGTYLVSRRVVL